MSVEMNDNRGEMNDSHETHVPDGVTGPGGGSLDEQRPAGIPDLPQDEPSPHLETPFVVRLRETKPTYDNDELTRALERLEAIRLERVGLARTAAVHIIENNGGVTDDAGLFYTAMTGKSVSEGESEYDPYLIVTNKILNDVLTRPGGLIMVKGKNVPDLDQKVGILTSFSDETYTPAKFEIRWGLEDGEGEESKTLWSGGLALAVREFVPKSIGEGYKLSETVSKLTVCERVAYEGPTGELGTGRPYTPTVGGLRYPANELKHVEVGSKSEVVTWLAKRGIIQ